LCGFHFDRVTIETPAGMELVCNLSFKMKPSNMRRGDGPKGEITAWDNLLICGENGVGKTSICRCLKGLWPVDIGFLTIGAAHPNHPSEASSQTRGEAIFYLPQVPYCVLGTSLAELVIYPVVHRLLPESELRSLLAEVGLEYLLIEVR
jgi:ABC-type uncharacterized transport system fused permease/ATPase subunit